MKPALKKVLSHHQHTVLRTKTYILSKKLSPAALSPKIPEQRVVTLLILSYLKENLSLSNAMLLVIEGKFLVFITTSS